MNILFYSIILLYCNLFKPYCSFIDVYDINKRNNIIKKIIKKNIHYTHYYKANIFPYRPEEAVLLDSESLSCIEKLFFIREVNYTNYKKE